VAGPLITPSVVRIPIGHGTRQVALGEGAAWVLMRGGVVRVDPSTNEVGDLIHVPRNIVSLAVGEGSVWVVRHPNVRRPSDVPGSVVRIDAQTGKTIADIGVERSPSGIAVAYGSVWVSNMADGTLSKIDPRTNSVVATIHLGGTPPDLFAGGRVIRAGFGSLWIDNDYGNVTVIRMDPRTGKVQAVFPSAENVAVADGAVWVTRYGAHPEGPQRIDPVTNRFVGRAHESVIQPEFVALGDGTIWIVQVFGPTPRWVREHRGFLGPLSGGTQRVYRVDPKTFELLTKPLVVDSEGLPFAEGPPVIGYGSLWIPRRHDLLRIEARAGRSSQPPYYADAQAVADALEAKGTCRGVVDITHTTRLPGESIGACTVAGARVRISAYADPSWLGRGLRSVSSPHRIVGTNWIVATSSARAADAVYRVLGGIEQS
jgi:YVTN family beta-propeller protein